uniref:Uncharacterized protein n=1 Tax=Trichogramma kaykai TaxID=54128 RepID=A0ABD2XDG6_9HYME
MTFGCDLTLTDAQRVTARLSKKLNIPIITSEEVLSDDALILKHAPRCYAEAVIKSWKGIWSDHMKNNSDGWIFVASDDFGLNEHLANRLKYGGIVPTHVFAIVLSEEDSSDDDWINITGLKRAYKHLIKDIHAEGKKSRDIAEECLDLARRRYLFPTCDRSMRLLLLNFFKAELSADLARQLVKKCAFTHENELYKCMLLLFLFYDRCKKYFNGTLNLSGFRADGGTGRTSKKRVGAETSRGEGKASHRRAG